MKRVRWILLLCAAALVGAAHAANYDEADLGDFADESDFPDLPLPLALDSGINRIAGTVSGSFELGSDFDWFDVVSNAPIKSITLTVTVDSAEPLIVYAMSWRLIDYTATPPCQGCYPIVAEQYVNGEPFEPAIPMFVDYLPLQAKRYGLWLSGLSFYPNPGMVGDRGYASYEYLIDVAAVPEATSGVLLGAGLLALAGMQWRRRRLTA